MSQYSFDSSLSENGLTDNKMTKTSSLQEATNKLLESSCGKSTALCTADPMRIEPAKVFFESVEPGIRYVMNISVVNKTKVAQRIRFLPPKTGNFAVNYIPAGAVAPGLDVRAEVECQVADNASEFFVSDVVTVVMGQNKVDIPLLAQKPCSDVVFNSFLNFGLIPEKQMASSVVLFENRGEVAANVIFRKDVTSKFILDSSTAVIEPHNSFALTIKCDCKTLGPAREMIKVDIPGVSENMFLDVSAQVVAHTLSLLTAQDNKLLELADFGTMFYGQAKTIEAILVNNGPQQVNFTVNFPDDESDSSGLEKQMSVTPMDGTLNPFTQLPVTLHFKPSAPEPGKGFASQYIGELSEVVPVTNKVVMDAHDMDDDQKVHLVMNANVVMPTFELSPTNLRFGICPVNDRRDILMTLRNTSPISLKFRFTKGAQFSFTPQTGNVDADQSVSIIASFLPGQLGNIKKLSKLLIEEGLRSAEVRIMGECIPSTSKKKVIGGTARVQGDFKPTYKFVDPAEVKKDAAKVNRLEEGGDKFRREAPWDSKHFVSSTSWDEVYDSTNPSMAGGPPQSVSNDPVTFSLQELQRRAQHKNMYNEYVRTCHTKRQDQQQIKIKKVLAAKGRSDSSDPDGVDMGMERGLDDDPGLKIPVADEPLWLANRGDKGERPSFQIDEDRMIGKKAKEGPSTQAEIRECSAELNSEALRKISASHKVINFGKVCVNSINLKNFAITNELGQMVLIKLGTLDNELRQSKPKSQVLAAGSCIGFDIQFTCHEVCKYKRTFSWAINDKHSFKVTVLAEVVPIEVVLERQQITMEFNPESLEKTHTETVVMKNPGNAVAEFAWGNKNSFKCSPEQGNLYPGQSMVVSVTWFPSSVPSENSEEIGLIVVGGTEQSLSVTGVLAEAKVVFEEKKVNIGTIAVGGEKVVTTRLKNIGASTAVFHVGDLAPNLCMEVTPDRAKLQPGESIEISLRLTPKGRLHYDNKALQVLTRGGKPASIKLSGEAIFPKVAMLQESLGFGHVVTGSSQEAQFSLVNSGTIDAVVYLDLTSFIDFSPSLTSSAEHNAALNSSGISEDSAGNILEKEKQAELSCLWKFMIRSGCTCHCNLIFSPSIAKEWDFRLPLALQGLSPEDSLCKPVTAKGLLSRLTVSSHIIDFGDKVVSRDPTSRMSYFLEVTFKNVDVSCGLSYDVRDTPCDDTKKAEGARKPKKESSEIEQPEFFVSPVTNDLAPGESTTMRVTFLPKRNGDFTKVLHIYISDQPDTSRPYFTITCRGSGVYPRLGFSKPKIILPPVPLNISSKSSCHVYNLGYDNIELKFRVSPTIPIPLNIQFPESNELGLTRDKCLLVISAKSDRPVSWSGKIEFYDNDGEKFAVEVSGCADCSMLTAYPFVRDYADRYGFLGLDDQPVRYSSKKEISILKANEVKMKSINRKKGLVRQNSSGDMAMDDGTTALREFRVDDDDEGVDVHRAISTDADGGDVKILLKWLNCFICRKQFDVDNFLQNILSTHGDIVVDCLEQLSGKRVSSLVAPSFGQPKIPGDNDRRGSGELSDSILSARVNQLNKLIAKYRNLLNFLTKYGGLVMHISALSLLDLDGHMMAQEIEFKKVEGMRLTQAMLKERRSLWEEEWKRNCVDAWSQILFQSFKVFVLSRVTYSNYLNTPGIVVASPAMGEVKTGQQNKSDSKKKKKEKGPKTPPELHASNILSQSESIVYAWVAYHQLKAGRLGDTKIDLLSSNNPRMPSMNRRLVDIGTEFADFFAFCQIIHSHLPELTSAEGVLAGYTYTEPQDVDKNFSRFSNALTELRINFGVTLQELTNSARAMVIMVTHLFLNLPNLIPKTTIEFKGLLGAPSVKTVELQNPSNKAVSYDVTLDGPRDFSIDVHSITLEPNSTSGFLVKCNPHFSKVTKGKLIFWGIRENGVGGSNIVFDLVSRVTDRLPLSSIKRNVNLYDNDRIEIDIKNPFEKDCTFSISLVQHHVPATAQQLLGENMKQSSGTGHDLKNSVSGTNQAMAALLNEVSGVNNVGTKEEEDENLTVFKDPFWCNDTTLVLGAKESKKIYVHSLPFILGVYTCQVVFVEENTGEFCHEIALNVGLPKPSEELCFEALEVDNGNSIQKTIKVSSTNSPFEKAVMIATDARLALNKRAKARISLQGMLASSISNEETGQSQFAVNFNSPNFTAQKEFGLVTSGAGGGGGASGRVGTGAGGKRFTKNNKNSLDSYNPDDNTLNSIPFTFFPEKAGVYTSQVVLYSLSNQYDIRVLALRGAINASQSGMTIKFTGAARRKITQEIPVHNESEKDWNLQAHVVGSSFSAPKTIVVPSHSKVPFPVSFTAQGSGDFQGSLILKNPAALQDSFEFKLEGAADDPLAEDNLVFKCKARCPEMFCIQLPDVGNPKVYTVETDLSYITGDEEILIKDGTRYEFSVNCPVGGIMSGSITFKDPTSDNLIWYTVTIEVTSPVAESTINVEAEVRKAVSVEIALDNPTPETLEFHVALEGEGLLGDSTYFLPPSSSNQSSVYELIFSPLKVGKFFGSITFQNDSAGEFWYKLVLEAHPATAIVIDPIECMVGSSKAANVPIENPLAQSVVLSAESFDPKHFSVSPEFISLGPYSQDTFEVRFCPSSLNEDVATEIVVSHPSLGDMVYEVSGRGLLPGIMPPINISAPMKEIGSHTILFRNSFTHPLPVDVFLCEDVDGNDCAFTLLLRKSTGLVIAPESSLQVAISFSPTRLCDYHARVEFRSSLGGHNFLWCYPICGLAEAGIAHKLPKMSTACKSSLLREVDIPLIGLQSGQELSMKDFSVEILTSDPKLKVLVTRTFRIQPVGLINTNNLDEQSIAFRYRLLFEPLRVFSADVEFVIVCNNKGRWRAEVELDALDPPTDDTINLTAPVGGSDKVSFRLSNRFLGYSPFEAYFSARSSPHFTVTPSSGVLAPFGSAEGTKFEVTFSPKEYGIRERANLIVTTEEAQWNYEITGTYPDVSINSSQIKSKIDAGRR